MSTRCMIGIKSADGTVQAVYCHHDGYLNGVGRVLLAYYRDERKIRQLMELGNISSLGAFPIREAEVKTVFGTIKVPNLDEMDTFIGCDDYGGAAEDEEAITYESVDNYLEEEFGSDREYLYLFDSGTWYSTTAKSWEFKKLRVK